MNRTPLQYLMDQLKLTTRDWTSLSDKDKTDLKWWAQQEMEALAL